MTSQPLYNAEVDPKSSLFKGLKDNLISIQGDLVKLEHLAPTFLISDSKSGEEIIEYVCANVGKQIRPSLFLMCSQLVGYKGLHLYPMALVGEFVHNASLLHDDVVDDSPLRRNKPTPKVMWGTESAVLVGDLIYSTASELMARTGIMEIVASYARAIRLMSDGELIQLDHLYDLNISLDTYLTIVSYKTAELLGTVCKSAALLANRTPEEIEALYQFGNNIGKSFQIIDDALDYLSSTENMGKNTQSDLKDGKVTYPIILLRDVCQPAEWELVVKGSTVEILKLMEKHDIVSETLKFARAFTEQAKNNLQIFPDSKERQALEKIAHQLLLRTV